jgi:hypothetical protein
MALTIVEAAKLNPSDVLRSAIVEMYAHNSDILRTLPFNGIAGNALRYTRDDTLPGVGFRGSPAPLPASIGILKPITVSLAIASSDLDVDRFIVQTMGANQRSTREAMKVKALAHRWTLAFGKGDLSTESREFDGLQRRIPVGSLQLTSPQMLLSGPCTFFLVSCFPNKGMVSNVGRSSSKPMLIVRRQ